MSLNESPDGNPLTNSQFAKMTGLLRNIERNTEQTACQTVKQLPKKFYYTLIKQVTVLETDVKLELDADSAKLKIENPINKSDILLRKIVVRDNTTNGAQIVKNFYFELDGLPLINSSENVLPYSDYYDTPITVEYPEGLIFNADSILRFFAASTGTDYTLSIEITFSDI